MKNAQVLKLYDLIQEIKKTDEVLRLHQNLSADTFMVEQYTAHKNKVFAKIITELMSPTLASSVSYQLVVQLVQHFYGTIKGLQPPSGIEKDLLELQTLALAS